MSEHSSVSDICDECENEISLVANNVSSIENIYMYMYIVKVFDLQVQSDRQLDPIVAENNAGKLYPDSRTKLKSWLYREFRIKLTDGRRLKGNFLCTDADANVILGMCMEDTEKGGEVRVLGLVMVPGRHIVKMEIASNW